MKKPKHQGKVKVVCNNCSKLESTIIELVQNLEDSNQTILRLLQKIKTIENQNEIRTVLNHNRALTLADFNMSPDMLKEQHNIIQNQATKNNNKTSTFNERETTSDNAFNFTLEMYSYEETESILSNILSQVSKSNSI